MKKVFSVIIALMLVLPCFSGLSVFADGEVTGTIKGATLNIGSSLTLDYYATVSSGTPTMRFTTSNGRVTTVDGTLENGTYKFAYTGINPQCMTENIKAELIVDGNVLDIFSHTLGIDARICKFIGAIFKSTIDSCYPAI